jgi:superfamily II DNA or RNA helicase
MLSFMEQFPLGRILIVVPTTALLDQWYVGLTEDLNVAEAEIATYSGTSRASKPRRVNLAVLNTARNFSKAIGQGSDCFIIVDECHRAGTTANHLAMRGEFKAALGLSATPVREYDAGFEDFVVPVLGKVIYEYDYSAALADGVIAPFGLVNVRVSLLPSEKAQYDRLTKRAAIAFQRLKSGAASDQHLKLLLQQRATVSAKARMRLPVTAKLVEAHPGARIIVFHERIPEATEIATLLKQRHVRATLYHSGLGQGVRRDNLRLFRRGLFDCLVTCRALDEGVNVPEASVAIISSATRSKRQRIQRLGRVLRPSEGKTSSTVYTLFATPPEVKQLEKEAGELEGVIEVKWLTGKARENGENPAGG